MKNRKNNRQDLLNAEDFEVDDLREVVFGDSDRLSKVVALTLLGRKTYPDKLEDLQRVLADDSQTPRLRHTAAIELSRTGLDEALEVLIDALVIKDKLVLHGVLDALCNRGGHRALKAIAKLRDREEVAQSADWAATQIAYRLGVEGFRIAFPKQNQFIKINPRRAQAIKLEPADTKAIAKSIEDLSKSTPGIRLSSERAMTVHCGDRTWMFLFNKEFTGPKVAQKLLKRKALVCVLATRYVIDSSIWAAKYYVLTQPAKCNDSVQILITTTKGTLAFAGTAEAKGERVVFTLRTVEHSGTTLVDIAGVYEPKVLRFERASFELRRLKKSALDIRRR